MFPMFPVYYLSCQVPLCGMTNGISAAVAVVRHVMVMWSAVHQPTCPCLGFCPGPGGKSWGDATVTPVRTI